MIKRLPWLRDRKKTDPEAPLRLPLEMGAMSNGEGWWPDNPRKQKIRKIVMDIAEIPAVVDRAIATARGR